MPKTAKNPADYILPLDMNGLSGRMLRMPAPKGKTREILFVYGHHSSLERWFGVAEYLNKYGDVTVPDLPGFGGMDPFYKIGEKPTLDNLADYLASFIKFRYKNRRFTLGGLSLGFMIITRMLQKYPEIAKQIDILGSFAGFVHHEDFKYNRRTFLIFRYGSAVCSQRLAATFIRHVLFQKVFIRLGYKFFEPIFVKDQSSKVRDASPRERKRRIEFEIHLWQCNDVRTYFSMGPIMLTLDLLGTHVNLPVYHVGVEGDRYFNNLKVEEHMRKIYKDFHPLKHKGAHSPSVIAGADEAAVFFPPSLGKLLNREL